MLLPFIDLGYSKWVAIGPAQTVTILLVVFGYALVTLITAAFTTSVIHRGE